MKKILVWVLALHAAAFLALAAAHAYGYVGFDVLTPTGVAGTLVVAALIAFAGADYRRRRAFKVRRPKSPDEPPPKIPAPDWTYTTRSN